METSTQKERLQDASPPFEAPPQVDLSGSPFGALLVAGISVGLLLIGWLAVYFLVFLPRGPIG